MSILSPTLINIFLERIMADVLENHEGTVRIGGKTVINFRFADDIYGLAGEEEILVKFVVLLDKVPTTYSMENSAEKTKLMTNKTSGINKEIRVNGQEFETLTNFKYLGSIVSDEGSELRHSPG